MTTKSHKHDVKEKPALPFVYVPAKTLPGVIAIPVSEVSNVAAAAQLPDEFKSDEAKGGEYDGE
jgi:hypothetical protein